MRIRRATRADAHAIAEVHVASWREAYQGIVPGAYLDALSVERREAQWASIVDEPAQAEVVYVAEDAAGGIIGFASGGPRREGDAAFAGEIYAIYLLREAWGQGAGRALLAAVARWLAEHGMRSMLVWVLGENPARRFYEALGGELLPGETPIEIGGRRLAEVAYGWRDTTALLAE